MKTEADIWDDAADEVLKFREHYSERFFPPVNMPKTAELLTEMGVSIDRLTAENYRYVLNLVVGILRREADLRREVVDNG